VQFRVLGPVEVEASDGRVLRLARRQERTVLAILLLAAGRMLPMDRLCELLWEEDPPRQARQTIRTYVARIRALLADAGAQEHGVELVADQGGYRLTVAPDTVDALLFRTLVERAGQVADLSERDRMLREALGLWRGPALHQAAPDALRQRLCADLEELRLRAVEESFATGLTLGRDRELLPQLARLLAEHPVRERLVELHMLALYRQGRTTEALEVYDRAGDRLRDELGLDPGPGLRQLHLAVLRGEPVPGADPVPVGRPARPAQLPADLAMFTGRTVHIGALDELLSGNATAVVISAIAGTAGVGKTALAVHWAHRVRDRFPDGQLYANLRGFDPTGRSTTTAEAIRGFLDALGVAPQRVPGTLDAQIGLYRSLLADKRVLVVLDNARDSEQVRPLLPGASSCMALVTSRNQLTGLVAVDGAHPLAVDLLTAAEARQLLDARLGTDRAAAEPRAVDDLTELCARLPLAVAIAAAHAAANPRLPLADLVTDLRRTRNALDMLTGDDAATDLRAVFSWSYNALGPDAARLFRLLSLHPGPDIGVPAAASLAGIPVARAGPLLAELARAHLLAEQTPGRYGFHDLLRAYATEQAEAHDADRQAATHRMLDHYLHTAHRAAILLRPHREPVVPASPRPGVTCPQLATYEDALTWFAGEQSVLVAAVQHAAGNGFDAHSWQLAWALTDFLARRGRWHDRETVDRIALESARRLEDRPAAAYSHRCLALGYTALRRYEDANTHGEQALDLYAELGDKAGQARTHQSLSWAFHRQDRPDRALRHAEQALDLYRAVDDPVGQATALNNIGWDHVVLGDHQQALVACHQALALFQALADHHGEALVWDTIGYAHHHLGDYRQAVTCFQHALDLFRHLGDRNNEADTLTNLGDAHHATGDADAARDTWRAALAILDELGHADAERVRTKLEDLRT
jgi:DNA-binding SARP family transcriptional activator